MKRLILAGAALLALAALPARSTTADDTSLGLGIGRVKPEVESSSLGNATWYTGNLRLKVSRYLALEPEVGYWKRTETVLGVESSLEDLNFGGSGLLILPTSRVELWAGAGAGGHRIKGKLAGFGASVSETQTKFGWHVLGGIDLKLSDHAAVFGAGRYDKIKGDESKSESDLDETKFYAGLRLVL